MDPGLITAGNQSLVDLLWRQANTVGRMDSA